MCNSKCIKQKQKTNIKKISPSKTTSLPDMVPSENNLELLCEDLKEGLWRTQKDNNNNNNKTVQ